MNEERLNEIKLNISTTFCQECCTPMVDRVELEYLITELKASLASEKNLADMCRSDKADVADREQTIHRLTIALRNIHRMTPAVEGGHTYEVVQALVFIQDHIRRILAGEPMPEDWE